MSALRGALRQFGRRPAFSATVVLALALGIGSCTLIYAVIRAVFLEPLPYDDAERIVRVQQVDERGNRANPSDPNFFDLKQQSGSFSGFAQFGYAMEAVAGGDEPARLGLAAVSREFLAVLRVAPVAGRAFTDEEHRFGAAPAALVSYGYWQRYLGGTPDFGSRALKIGDRTHTIVGVLPASFDYPSGAQVWVPRELWPVSESRTGHNYQVVARLAPGRTLETARAELGAIARRLKAEYGEDTWMSDVRVVTLREFMVGDVRPALLAMSAAVALVLLVAFANVTSMLLVQAAGRARELGVRLALGAGRAALVRLFFMEALMLSVAGAALGIALAAAGLELLQTLEAGALPRAHGLRIDGSAVAVALLLSVAVAVALGLAVAAMANLDGVAGSGAQRAIGGRSSSRFRDGLLSAQVALALVLVVGAALLGRSFVSAAAVDPGYRVDDVLLMNLAVARPSEPEGRARLAALYAELLTRLRALPGVEAAGGISSPPLAGDRTNGSFVTMQRPDEIADYAALRAAYLDPSRRGFAEFRLASDGYFEAMGLALVRGRFFDARDGAGAPHAAIVSRSLAEAQWPGQDPLGKLIQFGGMDGDLTAFTVIGVAADVYDYGVDSVARPTFYASYRQRQGHLASFWVALRAADPAALIPAARSVVRNLDPDLPPGFRLAAEVYADTFAARRLNLVVLGTFGASALLLALVGIYGAVSFAVARRTREIGLRLALGAPAATVVRAVMARSFGVVAAGLAAGVAVSIAASSLVSSMLHGVPPHDPLTYVAAALALSLGAALAAWWPARRAAAVDPNVALRQE
jgi:putative ABC transport system permease protein